MKLSRRNTIAGLGTLAFGSGAAFTSAAFQNSVSSDADMRVIVDQRLTVEAGDAFESNGEVALDDQSGKLINPNYSGDDSTGSGFFDGTDDLGSVFDDEDPPLATVTARDDGRNGDIRMFNAMDYPDSASFGDASGGEGFLRVRNDADESVLVGIAYNEGQYGNDVDESYEGLRNQELEDNKLSRFHVQKIYQFNVSGGEEVLNEDGSPEDGSGAIRISPNPTENGVRDESNSNWSIDRESDRPDNVVNISPGDDAQIELEVNTNATATDLDPDPSAEMADIINADPEFGGESEMLDLLDEITVGTIDEINK